MNIPLPSVPGGRARRRHNPGPDARHRVAPYRHPANRSGIRKQGVDAGTGGQSGIASHGWALLSAPACVTRRPFVAKNPMPIVIHLITGVPTRSRTDRRLDGTPARVPTGRVRPPARPWGHHRQVTAGRDGNHRGHDRVVLDSTWKTNMPNSAARVLLLLGIW